jgi:hypothetical protein
MDDHAGTQALIGSIYETGLDPAGWPAFLERLGGTLHAGYGTLWVHDFANGAADAVSGGNIAASMGLDAATRADYAAHYASCNVWVPQTSKLPEGSVTVSSSLYPDGRLPGTEFYRGFLKPNDLFYAVGTSIVKRGTRDVKMGFGRSRRAGGYTESELRLVRGLMPHLRNAVVLHQKMHHVKTMMHSATAALEMVPMGVILLTHAGRLLHANTRAHELMAITQALRIGADGALQVAGPADADVLHRMVGECVDTAEGRGKGHGGTMQLPGPAGRRLQILVTPLPLQSAAFAATAPVAIFCSDPDAVAGALSQRLEAMYRMTTAEAQLTEALVNGRSLQHYAQARCVTLNTLRTQLKSASAKAGAKRQADLVRIVLTGPALFGTRD